MKQYHPEMELKLKENNLIDIVEMDSLDRLEAYKDKFPFLAPRKCICRQRINMSRICMAIISHPVFDYFSLFVIVLNSITLAFYDPINPNAFDTGIFAYLDSIFLSLYTAEMILKVCACGFILNKGSYLRDSWNILDFIIIIGSYLQIIISFGTNINVLRSFRVLRPLRTISGIEGLRVIVTVLMKSITLLIDILIILAFFFSIFAIAGLNLWFGVLKHRCINISTGAIHPDHDFCGSNKCPSGYVCAKTDINPNYGATSFDNIFYSFLIVIQSVTLEGWVYNMIAVEKASNYLSLLFFIPLIFVGAFFLLNLFLVVLKEKFTEEQTLIKEKNKNKIKLIKSEEQLKKDNEENIVYSSLKRINDNHKALKIDQVDSDDSHAQRKHLQNLTSLRQSQLDINNSKIFTPTSKLSTKFIENNKSLSIKNCVYEESKEDIYLKNSNEASRSDICFTHCSDFGFDFSNKKYNKDNLPI